MSGLFDVDGGLMGSLGKITDVIILSLLFIVFSIPIFTIGASMTALYYTSVKCIRRGRGYIFKSFWKAFKENFFNATLLWVLIMIIVGILGLNFRYSSLIVTGKAGFVLLCVYVMMSFVLLLAAIYVFPLLSRFNMKKKDVIVNSFLMGIKHLPFSILMVIIFGASALLLYLMPPFCIFIPAGGSVLFSLLMEKILKKYTPTSEDGTKDEWYLE